MGKGNLRGKSHADQRPKTSIKSGATSDVLDGLLRFSLKFYDPDHPTFNCEDREVDYFHKLLDRVKDLSKEKVSALTNRKADKVTRFHQIDFSEARVAVDGFGIPGWEEYKEDAWQFSITKAEHGRVHGFLIENVFYIVWLDPHHRLYPGK